VHYPPHAGWPPVVHGIITHEFALADINAALDLVSSGKASGFWSRLKVETWLSAPGHPVRRGAPWTARWRHVNIERTVAGHPSRSVARPLVHDSEKWKPVVG
jgi:hypothetical protein